jgi:hypothetical protein
MHKPIIGLALALSLGLAGNAFADHKDRAGYKSAKDKIEEQARADKKACEGMKENAKDVCQAEAKAKEKIAKAELDAHDKPGPKADEKVTLMKAEGAYEVAKEKCEDQKDTAVACKKEAKATYDKAKADAKTSKAKADVKTDAKKS